MKCLPQSSKLCAIADTPPSSRDKLLGHRACLPPSTGMLAPVMNDA